MDPPTTCLIPLVIRVDPHGIFVIVERRCTFIRTNMTATHLAYYLESRYLCSPQVGIIVRGTCTLYLTTTTLSWVLQREKETRKWVNRKPWKVMTLRAMVS